VTDGLRAAGRGFAVGPMRVPIVPGAILFDLLNGGAKDWAEDPYPALGRAALAAGGRGFRTRHRRRGLWCHDRQRWKGGLGSASAVLPSGITVGALAR
jgi:L-aminopeptidase/D-esterase-like protein